MEEGHDGTDEDEHEEERVQATRRWGDAATRRDGTDEDEEEDEDERPEP